MQLIFSVANKQICHLLIFVFANPPPALPPAQPKLPLSPGIADNSGNYPLLQGSSALPVPS